MEHVERFAKLMSCDLQKTVSRTSKLWGKTFRRLPWLQPHAPEPPRTNASGPSNDVSVRCFAQCNTVLTKRQPKPPAAGGNKDETHEEERGDAERASAHIVGPPDEASAPRPPATQRLHESAEDSSLSPLSQLVIPPSSSDVLAPHAPTQGSTPPAAESTGERLHPTPDSSSGIPRRERHAS